MSYVRLGLLVAAVAALASSHVIAYRAGAESERTAALSRSVDVMRDRMKTDDRIKGLAAADLCRTLGGVWRDNRCE